MVTGAPAGQDRRTGPRGVAVRGVHGADLRRTTGGRVLIGRAVGEGIVVVVDERDGVAVLRAADELGPAPGDLRGPVRLWWPGGRGRWEVDGELSTGPGGPAVQVRWPPREVQERGHVRAPVDVKAWAVQLDGEGTATGRVLDLSAGGAALVLDRAAPWWEEGRQVVVCLLLPGQPVVLGATVVRTGRRGRTAGLRFHTVAAADQDRLTAVALAADSRRAGR